MDMMVICRSPGRRVAEGCVIAVPQHRVQRGREGGAENRANSDVSVVGWVCEADNGISHCFRPDIHRPNPAHAKQGIA